MWPVQPRPQICRNRIIHDRTHPLEEFDDLQVLNKFRFCREDIFEIIDEVKDGIEYGSQ